MICPRCFEDIAVAHACKAPDANPANLTRIYAEMQRLNLQVEALTKPEYGHWSSIALALKAAQKDLAAANLQISELKKAVNEMLDEMPCYKDSSAEFFDAKVKVETLIEKPVKESRKGCPEKTGEGFGCMNVAGHDGPHVLDLRTSIEKRQCVVFCSTCDSEGDVHRKECPQNPANLHF